MSDADSRNHGNDSLPWLFFLLAVITRVPFTSGMLLHVDSCQFSMALEKFDITFHQPHPPGYILYILMGRLLNFFISDPNTVFVTISVFFSGLMVASVYLLGKEIFERKTGVVAALIALSSPTAWFHGEVALVYMVEAFFSAATALFCWRILKGEEKYLWISVVILGVGGGIRQTTPVFLLPVWLYSIRNLPFRKIVAALGVLAVTCLLWFVPLLWMSGGWNPYREAFRELWLFNTGGHSLLGGEWFTFVRFFFKLIQFIVFGLGASLFPFCMAAYLLARRKKLKSLDSTKALFFSLWVVPVMMFYLFVFLSIQNPGYILIFLPAFFVLASYSCVLIGNEFRERHRSRAYWSVATAVVVLNTAAFFLLQFPVSHRWIRTHDRDLSVLLADIRTFNPGETAVFVNNYIYYSYRHIMYFLPEYRVYNVDWRVVSTGEVRKTFHGHQKETFLSEGFPVPDTIKSFVAPLSYDDTKFFEKGSYAKEGIIVRDLTPDLSLATGPMSLIRIIFPEVRVRYIEKE